VVRQKYVYKSFVVSLVEPEMAGVLRLRTEPAEVTGLSNHGRNVLKTLTLQLAQGERNL